MESRLEKSESSEDGAWTNLELIPTGPVQALFLSLGKALRAHRLYDANNPVYVRFLNSFRDALTQVWKDTETLQIQVEEHRLLFMGEEVYRSQERADSLSFLFWKDGIREIVFQKGLEQQEVVPFLDALQRSRTLTADGEDLLTVLWEADLTHFRYGYVDLLADGVAVPEAGDTGEFDPSLVLEGELAEAGDEEDGDAHVSSINPDDFNPTLYSLGAAEMDYLRAEIDKEMSRDLRGDVLSALFDRLEEPDRPERQLEILRILHSLLPNLLSRGALDSAGQIMEELDKLMTASELLAPDAGQSARGIVEDMSRPASLVELTRSLRDGTIATDTASLAHLLQFLNPEALPALLKLARESGEKLRPVLREGVHGIARRHAGDVGKLLAADDPVLVAEAVLLIGRLGVIKAIPAVGKLMSHPDHRVRLACLEVMVRLKASSLYANIQRLLDDDDRNVRIAAARAAGLLGYKPAQAWLGQQVTGKDLRFAELSEKMAIFQAYGALGGSGAETVLARFLTGRGFLRRKEHEEVRACAALALGEMRTEKARAILLEARDDQSPMVRNAVRKALKPRGRDGETVA